MGGGAKTAEEEVGSVEGEVEVGSCEPGVGSSEFGVVGVTEGAVAVGGAGSEAMRGDQDSDGYGTQASDG